MSIREKVKAGLTGKTIDWYQHSTRRFYISIRPENIKEVARILFKDLGLRFATASGQDTPAGLEILYHFSFDQSGEIFSVRVLIEDKKNPEIDSLANIFAGAEWIEREMWELLGIKFIGHPNLKHLLLLDDWPKDDYPLRHEHES